MLQSLGRRRWLPLVPTGLTLFLCVAIGPRIGVRTARAQTSDDQSLLLLAERLLSGYIPGPAGNAPGNSVQLYPGAPAPDFPTDVPMSPGSALIGSDEHPSYTIPPPFIGSPGVPTPQIGPSTPSGVHVDVVLDVRGSASNLTSFYQQSLPAAGWMQSGGDADTNRNPIALRTDTRSQ